MKYYYLTYSAKPFGGETVIRNAITTDHPLSWNSISRSERVVVTFWKEITEEECQQFREQGISS